MSFQILNSQLLACNKCKRLREWAKSQQGKHNSYKNEEYWARPVPSFGDEDAKLLIIGLAPGAHGANRTGRVFTGDPAGDLLFETLFKYGLSSKKQSEHKDDDLVLNKTYICNAVRCAPPKNKPNAEEFNNCRRYLLKELELLRNLKVIITLGEKAFDQTKKALRDLGADVDGFKFGHALKYDVDDFPTIITSYHTSKYNINTGKISSVKLDLVFTGAIKLL